MSQMVIIEQNQWINPVDCRGVVNFGLLSARCGWPLPLKVVCDFNGVYVIGTEIDTGLVTRESEECWATEKEANEAWLSGRWTQSNDFVQWGDGSHVYGMPRPIEVLINEDGQFYLGTETMSGPFTQESQEVWGSFAQAEQAWRSGQWTQAFFG